MKAMSVARTACCIGSPPIERHAVYHGADNDPATHEFADCVNPTHDQGVPGAQHVEQSLALRALGEASADTGHASQTTLSILNPAALAWVTWWAVVCSAVLTRA
jgi:hypothetical protein